VRVGVGVGVRVRGEGEGEGEGEGVIRDTQGVSNGFEPSGPHLLVVSCVGRRRPCNDSVPT
jgi:hypothetical protein